MDFAVVSVLEDCLTCRLQPLHFHCQHFRCVDKLCYYLNADDLFASHRPEYIGYPPKLTHRTFSPPNKNLKI